LPRSFAYFQSIAPAESLRLNNIIEFVQRKQQDPKTPLPTGDLNDDKKHSGSMLELLNTQSGAVAAPSTNELLFH